MFLGEKRELTIIHSLVVAYSDSCFCLIFADVVTGYGVGSLFGGGGCGFAIKTIIWMLSKMVDWSGVGWGE